MDSDGTAAETPARRLVAQADKVWGDDGMDAADPLYAQAYALAPDDEQVADSYAYALSRSAWCVRSW